MEFTEYRNNPRKVLNLRVDMESSAEELQTQIKSVLETLCPFMLPDGRDSDLRIRPLTGGLSNHLFLVSNASLTTTPNAVLVRIHPDGEDHSDNHNQEEDEFCIVDRAFETKFAAWLASQHEDLPHNQGSMAPTMYGRFENGRVEEFYPNVRPLAWAEMKVYGPWLAQSMASFHTLDPPPEQILSRPPTSDNTTCNSATIYRTMRAWLKQAYAAQLDEPAKELLDQLAQEWEWLSTVLANPPQIEDSPIVKEALAFIRRMSITHMDCQPLNILVGLDEETTKEGPPALNSLRLIDYEYAGWNPIVSSCKCAQLFLAHYRFLTFI